MSELDKNCKTPVRDQKHVSLVYNVQIVLRRQEEDQ
jgi:hypothetical protein